MATGARPLLLFREARRTFEALLRPSPLHDRVPEPPGVPGPLPGRIEPGADEAPSNERLPSPGPDERPGGASAFQRGSRARGAVDPPISRLRAVVQLVLTAALVPICMYVLFGPVGREPGARDAASAILGVIVAFWMKD